MLNTRSDGYGGPIEQRARLLREVLEDTALAQVCPIFADAELVVAAAEVIRESEPELKITVAQALAKGDRDELAIQAATELGCWAVIPWQAERSISANASSDSCIARSCWPARAHASARRPS